MSNSQTTCATYDEAWELERRRMTTGIGLRVGPITWSGNEVRER